MISMVLGFYDLALLLPNGSQSLKLMLSHFVSCLLPPGKVSWGLVSVVDVERAIAGDFA